MQRSSQPQLKIIKRDRKGAGRIQEWSPAQFDRHFISVGPVTGHQMASECTYPQRPLVAGVLFHSAAQCGEQVAMAALANGGEVTLSKKTGQIRTLRLRLLQRCTCAPFPRCSECFYICAEPLESTKKGGKERPRQQTRFSSLSQEAPELWRL